MCSAAFSFAFSIQAHICTVSWKWPKRRARFSLRRAMEAPDGADAALPAREGVRIDCAKLLLAEVDQRTQASLAESDIMSQQKLAEARGTGDPAKVEELESQRVMIRQQILEKAEDAKQQIREQG